MRTVNSPMIRLRVSLFQTLRVVTEDGVTLDLGSPTSRSLFAYLLLNRACPVDRKRVAAVFWSRTTDAAARRNLRQYLHHIRRALETIDPHGEILNADSNTLQLNPQLPLWLDTVAFREGTRITATLDEMQNAIALYTGDLLEDVDEDWCADERAHLRQLYLKALDRLSQGLLLVGRSDEALAAARCWITAEPLDEEAHRRLLNLYLAAGDRNRAIQHYRGLVKLLEDELDAEPMPETQALWQLIQTGSRARPTPTPAPPRALPPQNRPSSPPPIPLVGRQSELAQLRQVEQHAVAGQGCFILITGESGIGKTRLVEEHLRLSGAPIVLRGSCHELELMTPYAPFRQALASVHELLPDLTGNAPPPAWAVTLAPLLPTLADRFPFLPSEPSPAHIADALTQLILHLSANARPLHLIVDDLHWGDSASWDLLAQLARQATSAPLVIFGLCRLEELRPERSVLVRTLERNDLFLSLPLRRLSPTETNELAGHLLPNDTDADLLQRLYQESEGNPFFIVETARVMRETGKLPATSTSGLNLPPGIQRVIQARLDRLEPDSRELLAAAAAIGRVFTFSLLVDITQMSDQDVIRHTEDWLQRDLVREDPNGYDFSHDKIRAVAYAGSSPARREYVHRRIAEALTNSYPPTDPATLAHHFARSDQPLRALPYLTQAGEQALRGRSYLAARQFGLQAINLLGRLPGSQQRHERVDLNLQLAQAYAFSGDIPRAVETLRETERLAMLLGDEERLAQVLYRSSQLFWLRGQPELAGDYARRLLRSAEEMNEPRLLQAALRMLGRVAIALADFDDAISYFLRYINLGYTALRPPDLPIVWGYLGVAYCRVGSWTRAREAAEQGLHLAEAEGASESIAFARMQLGFVHAASFDWHGCDAALAPVPDPLVDDPLTPLSFMVLGLRGGMLAHLGNPAEGIERIRRAMDWAKKSDYRVFYYIPQFFLAESLLLAGEIENALTETELALGQARAAHNRWAVAIALRLLADVITRLPNPDYARVEELLIESMQILRQVRARPDLARTYLALRRLYDRAGQISWAVDCHFRATTIFEELGMTEELRQAQGQPGGERRGAVVIPNLPLRGPNVAEEGN
jgi:DNA-binding SARP family transcriptional activator